LSNALKFTDKGQIIIGIRLAGRKENTVGLNFSVSDTGIGIPKEKLPYIFNEFFQVETIKNRKYSGAGLGLSIAKKLVQLMGGEIMVESEYKKGCTFSFMVEFSVSLTKDAHEETPLPVKGIFTSKLPALNVLVVEDDRINQKILKNLLEKSGCNVAVAANGKEALKMTEKRIFDVILMDIYMPEMNGYDTAKRIREKEAASGLYTPIIALTAAAQSEDRNKYLKLGIDDCIAKPCGRSQIYNAIAGVLKKSYKRPLFSLESLCDRLDGDRELVSEIIEEVISISYERELLEGIDRCLEAKDFDRLCSHIHKFKGSLSHFQAEAIDEVLSEIKEKCRNSDFSEINTLCSRLKKEYILLKESLMSCRIMKK
jgi:CheY-like chemotaxis protein/HPt (histidine-containing phosphotransfer) domain-containing protein